MNVYVETNFILELALVQQQQESCQRILELCKSGAITLVFPSFCVAEAYETLIRRGNNRKTLARDLSLEIGQIARSEPYKSEIETTQGITAFLVRSAKEDEQRLHRTLEAVFAIADTIPLEFDILRDAATYKDNYGLRPQDAVVYSSIVRHLASDGDSENCFLNRNNKDFDDPDIKTELQQHNCKMFFDFDNAYQFLQHRSGTTSSD